MAGRGPRTGGGNRQGEGARTGHSGDADQPPAGDDALVRIHDLAGRPRGTGFVADHHGTVITSHEAVDGLPRLVLHAAGDRTCLVTRRRGDRAARPGPGPRPHRGPRRGPAAGHGAGPGRDGHLCADRRRLLARGAGPGRRLRDVHGHGPLPSPRRRTGVGDRHGRPGRAAAGRRGGRGAGARRRDRRGRRRPRHRAPVRPTATAASPSRSCPAPSGPLADLLARNAATVPAYGADLNLAGVLELTATSVGQDGPPGTLAGYVGRADASVEPVERAAVRHGSSPRSPQGRPPSSASSEHPGSGRTTELAALAARRHRGPEPAPTLWLRGADLEDDDASVADAARRALARRRPHRRRRVRGRPAPVDGPRATSHRRNAWPSARRSRPRAAPCCSSSTAPRRCRRSSRTACAEWTEGTASG